ncbi:MAG: hypothetical protein ACLQO7_08880 [Candidatus Bathyarchaeia archaeon]
MVKAKPAKTTNQRQELFRARNRARRCFTELTVILENMPQMSDSPDLEFSRIFNDADMVGKVEKIIYPAVSKGVLYSDVRTYNFARAMTFSDALNRKGIKHEPYRLIHNVSYRVEMAEKLEPKELEGIIGEISASELKAAVVEDLNRNAQNPELQKLLKKE